jgi:monoamine oxidase
MGETACVLDTVVVGAGVSGLTAARALLKQGCRVILLEARQNLGGRVMQVNGIAPWPLEAGPEFVHGARSDVVTLLKKAGYRLQEKAWPNYLFWGDKSIFTPAAQDEGGHMADVETLMFEEVMHLLAAKRGACSLARCLNCFNDALVYN